MRVEVNEEVILLGGPCHGQAWRSPDEDIPDYIQQDGSLYATDTRTSTEGDTMFVQWVAFHLLLTTEAA